MRTTIVPEGALVLGGNGEIGFEMVCVESARLEMPLKIIVI
jgi:hypothetical protein